MCTEELCVDGDLTHCYSEDCDAITVTVAKTFVMTVTET
jgi:hypothetical protein